MDIKVANVKVAVALLKIERIMTALKIQRDCSRRLTGREIRVAIDMLFEVEMMLRKGELK